MHAPCANSSHACAAVRIKRDALQTRPRHADAPTPLRNRARTRSSVHRLQEQAGVLTSSAKIAAAASSCNCARAAGVPFRKRLTREAALTAQTRSINAPRAMRTGTPARARSRRRQEKARTTHTVVRRCQKQA
eukprot:1607947-Pleurochrysis_carterae.AAC.2